MQDLRPGDEHLVARRIDERRLQQCPGDPAPHRPGAGGRRLLPDGKVLVAGGFGELSSAELYDPPPNSWTSVPSMSAGRHWATATSLADGRVLVVGGDGRVSGVPATLASAELYDPATSTWTAAASMSAPRQLHTATLLGNGKVLVAGGSYTGDGGYSFPLSSAELYDPATDTWTPVAGGHSSSSIPLAELYDPSTQAWVSATPALGARSYHTATLLPNGDVLVAGGHGGSSTDSGVSAELFRRLAHGAPCVLGNQCQSGLCVDGVCCGSASAHACSRGSRGCRGAPARIAPFFETGAPNYDWLNYIVAIGSGRRSPGGITYEVYQVL